MYDITDKMSYYFSIFMLALMVIGGILYNVSPFYNNYKNGVFSKHDESNNITYQFSVHYVFPGFDPADHFTLATVINMGLTWGCAVSICSIDLYLCLMVFQIIAHSKILKYNLENVSDGNILKQCTINTLAVVKLSADENNAIHNKLKECIDHHKLIVVFVRNMSEFFGPVLAINYVFHLVCCCLLLLECSTGDVTALVRFVPLTIIIFGQLLIISITFEVVDTESEKLPDAVYSMPWELMEVRNQKIILIMLKRVQTPIRVTALGVTPVGVQTMAGILKTTFSYFTFLRSMS